MSLNEVEGLKRDVGEIIRNVYKLDEKSSEIILESTRSRIKPRSSNAFARVLRKPFDDSKTLRQVKSILKKNNLSRTEIKDVMALVWNEIKLNRRIERLQLMQNLFKYWHVAHLPFALVMLIIMVIHVVVTIVFGYKWIF